MKIYLPLKILITVCFFCDLATAAAGEPFIQASLKKMSSYHEVEIEVDTLYEGVDLDSFLVAIYENDQLQFYTEAKGFKNEEKTIFLIRASESHLQHINITLVYGDGILCDLKSFNYRLIELI